MKKKEVTNKLKIKLKIIIIFKNNLNFNYIILLYWLLLIREKKNSGFENFLFN